MDIKLIPVEKGSKFTFPALPEKVQGKYAAKYQSFDIISLGTVKVPKGTDVSEFSWDGVFFGASKKNEAIVKTNAWKSPNECVKILNDYPAHGRHLQHDNGFGTCRAKERKSKLREKERLQCGRHREFPRWNPLCE